MQPSSPLSIQMLVARVVGALQGGEVEVEQKMSAKNRWAGDVGVCENERHTDTWFVVEG